MSYSLSFYTNIQLVPLYVTIILPPVLLIVSCVIYHCKKCNVAEKLKFLAKATFGPPSSLLSTSQEQDYVYMNGHEVTDSRTLVVLGLYVLVFLVTTITVCWEVGIIDETYGNCDTTKMDCFVSTPDQKDVPVVNCSNYMGDDKATIVCFHPIGNVAAVPAVFGGMLSLIQLSMRLIAKACLWYYSIKELHYSRCLTGMKTSTTCLRVFHVVGLFLITIITVIIIPVLLKCFEHVLPHSGEVRFGGIVFLMIVALWLTAFVPWHRFGYETIVGDGGTRGKELPSSDTKKPLDSGGGLLLSIDTAEEESLDIPIEPIGGSYRPSGTGEGTVPTSGAKIVADSGGGSDGDKEQESRGKPLTILTVNVHYCISSVHYLEIIITLLSLFSLQS